ncbi:MAG: hypothetical protein K8T10_11305 [Candidatus Eremiobacteraeota bacterium]|nr:hypothetical protein [Candidatus Eremiobacteraeota bacterium]
MPRRRYSEEFYEEIDTLIRSQSELSNKRYEILKSARITEDEKEDKSKLGYVHAPSFWTIVKKSRLLAYVVIFICVIAITASVASIINSNIEVERYLKVEGNQQNINRKKKNSHKKTSNYKAYRGKLDVAKKPVPKSWPKKPTKSKLRPFQGMKLELKNIPQTPYGPRKKFIGDPVILDKDNLIFKK